MKAPSGLQAAGRGLWRAVHDALPKGWELDEAEVKLLTLACHQADDVAGLEAAIKRDGLTITNGRVNPAVAEVRQGRLAIGRLIGQLSIPDEEGVPRTEAARRAQRAARARWDRLLLRLLLALEIERDGLAD